MKRLLLILILTFSFQTLTKADDIRDFEIEGMSIGDSLLDFFDKKKINSNKPKYYDDNKFSTFELNFLTNSKLYDGLQIIYKTTDIQYLIHSITGVIDCANNFTICENKEKIIIADLEKYLGNSVTKKDKRKLIHEADTSGKSYVLQTVFEFRSGDRVTVESTNWSLEMNYYDNLRINVDNREFIYWLVNEAYN
jgi:hypothetical protein